MLATLLIAGLGTLAAEAAFAQATCSRQNCMPAEDEDLSNRKGWACKLPAPDVQGEGCTPVEQDADND